MDGRLGDWTGPALEIRLADPDVPPPERNTGRLRLTWDAEALYGVFEVEDHDLVIPPKEASALQLYQYDSVEIYVDAEGDASPRMRPDDFQFVITCDGRTLTLQGDELQAQAPLRVPKSFRAIPFPAAAVRTVRGYTVEFSLPWTVFGAVSAQAGKTFGLDAAWNDWTAAHEPFPVREISLEELSRNIHPATLEIAPASPDPESFVARHCHPWSWAGNRDFGYPDQWHRLRLVGGPTFGERLTDALRPWTLALSSVVVLLGAFLAISLGRARRRSETLRRRLEEVETALAAGASAPDPVPSSPLLLENRREERLAERAVATIEASLSAPLSPAELAGSLHISLRTLQRRLTQEMGCTPGELILEVKMRAARALLEKGELRVQEVGERVGFPVPYHFSRRFKAHFGVSPSEIRPRTS